MLLPLLFSNIFSDSDNFTSLKTRVCNIKVQLRLFECKCARVDSTEMKQNLLSLTLSSPRWGWLMSGAMFHMFHVFMIWSEWSRHAEHVEHVEHPPRGASAAISYKQWWELISDHHLVTTPVSTLKHLQCPVSSSVQCPLSQFVLQLILWPVLRELRRRYLPPPLLQYK